jgi:methanogenic corrinoid protein MtbC1
MAGLRQRYEGRECWEDADGTLLDRSPLADPPLGPGPDPAEQSLGQLTHAIEAEIIPRLLLARRALAPMQNEARRERESLGTDDVSEFSRLVLAHDVGVATAYIETIRARGVSLETIYLDLLSPTARLLGDLWNDDLCDFTEVTVGLWRLHQVVREFSPSFHADVQAGDRQRRALLVAMPGEQHTFGLVLMAEFFRRAGWDVWSGPIASSGELLSLVRTERFGMIGLSMSCGAQLHGLASEIHAVRRASLNRALGVMVGGSVFIDHPELVALVGADATAIDARQAVTQAESLVSLMARAC